MTYIECYEHRLLAGFPAGDDMVVHHRNEIKSDNSVANLEILTENEHLSGHNRQADDEFISRLYLSGLSTYRVAATVGLDPSNVWHSLKRSRTPLRSRREAALLNC